jgi:MFS family permease
MQLLTQIPISRMYDQMGRKKILLLGLTTFPFLQLLYIYAKSIHSLLFIRALGGLGTSAVWPIVMAMIVDQAEAKTMGGSHGPI